MIGRIILPWQATIQCAQRVSTCDKNSNNRVTTKTVSILLNNPRHILKYALTIDRALKRSTRCSILNYGSERASSIDHNSEPRSWPAKNALIHTKTVLNNCVKKKTHRALKSLRLYYYSIQYNRSVHSKNDNNKRENYTLKCTKNAPTLCPIKI